MVDYLTPEWAEHFKTARHVAATWRTPKQWQALREWYALVTPKILRAGLEHFAYDKYATGWFNYATPIERMAWEDMSALRMAFYPQYPIGPYFADFANPRLKVAIELDGAKYHDKQKDAIRDAKIKSLGWSVYRIPGYQCARIDYVDTILEEMAYADDDDAVRNALFGWAYLSCNGVLTGIRNIHIGGTNEDYEFNPDTALEDEWRRYAQELATESARQHCTTK